MTETINVEVTVPGVHVVGSPSDGQAIVWDATPGQWVPGAGGGGGGFTPITCILNRSGVEVSTNAGSGGTIAWNAVYDEAYNFNEIDLPDGLGLDIPLDGSDGTMTVTEAGTWIFDFTVYLPNDATGALFAGPFNVGYQDIHIVDCTEATWVSVGYCQGCMTHTMTLPVDTEFSWFVREQLPATAAPWVTGDCYLGITRIA